MKTKCLAFLLAFTIGYVLVLQVSTLFPYLFEGDTPLEQVEGLPSVMVDTFLHPIETTQLLITENVPLYYVGVMAVFLYSLYLSLIATKGKKDSGWEVDKKEQSYGSAHFAKKGDIINKTEFIGAKKQDVFAELKESMKQRKEP
ncbi:hypothetical protein ACFPU1_16700 [Thalassorhabdus alkalitolerans]|uniref:Uncharacterized protein n=1 Tax=Thalassorhabdus alkalitolerans TaxID=2282697 RepID=A0ABW0YSM3_9BACI